MNLQNISCLQDSLLYKFREPMLHMNLRHRILTQTGCRCRMCLTAKRSCLWRICCLVSNRQTSFPICMLLYCMIGFLCRYTRRLRRFRRVGSGLNQEDQPAGRNLLLNQFFRCRKEAAAGKSSLLEALDTLIRSRIRHQHCTNFLMKCNPISH